MDAGILAVAGVGVPTAAAVVAGLRTGAVGIAGRVRLAGGRADVGQPDRRAEGAAVRGAAALRAAVAVGELLGIRDVAGTVGNLKTEPHVSHRIVAAYGIVLLDVLLHRDVVSVAGAGHGDVGSRELMHPLAVREGPAVPGAVRVIGLRVPGVATADVPPFAGITGARAVEAGHMVVRARLVLMVAAAEIEIDVAG